MRVPSVLRKLLTVAGVATAVAAVGSFVTPAHADNITLDQWYTGHFNEPDTPLLGGAFAGGLGVNGPLLGGGFGNAIDAPDGPWEITLTGPGTLTITDVEISGDFFTLFNNGNPMTAASSPFTAAGQNSGQTSPGGGNTSVPVANASSLGEDINAALGDANFSSATFLLVAGLNSITGVFHGAINFGDFNFIVEAANPVPLPAGLPLFATGLAGLGWLARRKKKQAS